jgi:putative chitinase
MHAARSAGWFWKVNNLASFADAGDVKGMTKKINGGFIGLEARQSLYDKILKAMNV